MTLCAALPVLVLLIAVVVRLLQFIRWIWRHDDILRGERPHFMGLVLALMFSMAAASEILPFQPFKTLAELNPVPGWMRGQGYIFFLVVLAVLSLVCIRKPRATIWHGRGRL